MAMIGGWRVLSLFVITSLFAFEEWVSRPACKVIPSSNPGEAFEYGEDPEDLKVMMVADLLLLGPEAGYVNHFFRYYYMSKFFRKSFESLKPDLLLVLGDISAKGSELTKSKWMPVLRRFYQMLGPFVGLPLHVILGDRDIGKCSDIDVEKIKWIAKKFPGLDPSGCGAFEIGNTSFVSLNAVALLCGKNNLRFDVEKVIESESLELHMEAEGETEAAHGSINFRDAHNFGWRESTISSGSGPVLLLHFPLDRARNGHYGGVGALRTNSKLEGLNVPKRRKLVGADPYKLFQTLPANATEYIFQALKPRIIFSAHRHEFSDYIHLDKTREVTVPTMSWNAKDDPGFVVATFQKSGKAVSISYCSLARESHILLVYIFIVVILCLACLKG
ncbi:hypothetical protein L6164_030566 [Bauhinia variegata]|uniref:Uncharacterized protein n=1 Tax=Bauhinia variegata TaxID=167791 RepID=A0ACB9LD36_BAUVA|nr:hypothetical protein L6164_030566 [Bauhinia variegata]